MKLFFTKKDNSFSGIQSIKETLEKLKDGNYKIEIKKVVNIRSIEQNNYYRGVVLPVIADFMGETNDDLHDIFKFKFLQVRERLKKDKRRKFTRIKSTTELTTMEFIEYIDKIILVANQLNLIIPKPYYEDTNI